MNRDFNKNVVLFMPLIGGGGVEKNLFIIANFLSKKFKKIYICTSCLKNKTKTKKNVYFLNSNKNKKCSGLITTYFYALISLLKFLLKNKNTLVISFQANIYCILICKLFNSKIISRVNASPKGWSNNYFKKIIFKIVYKFSDKIIVNSKNLKFQMKNIFNLNTTLIYNPLNIKEIKKKSIIKPKINFFKSKKYLNIINIGRLTDQKDQITILKSINRIKEKIPLKLIIIGSGKMKIDLLKFIFEKKLNNTIKLINYINNPYGLLKKADLFILSSKYEGLPNVLLEAAVLKKFIISTNCPTGPSEILENGKFGFLFKISNHYDLSKKIYSFFKMNKKKRRNITENLYNSLHKYNYFKNLDKYLNIIKNV